MKRAKVHLTTRARQLVEVRWRKHWAYTDDEPELVEEAQLIYRPVRCRRFDICYVNHHERAYVATLGEVPTAIVEDIMKEVLVKCISTGHLTDTVITVLEDKEEGDVHALYLTLPLLLSHYTHHFLDVLALLERVRFMLGADSLYIRRLCMADVVGAVCAEYLGIRELGLVNAVKNIFRRV